MQWLFSRAVTWMYTCTPAIAEDGPCILQLPCVQQCHYTLANSGPKCIFKLHISTYSVIINIIIYALQTVAFSIKVSSEVLRQKTRSNGSDKHWPTQK